MYKFKEKGNVISVINEDDTAVARYAVGCHWQEKNVSVRDGRLYIRLYSRTSCYRDCPVELNNNEEIQKMPKKK